MSWTFVPCAKVAARRPIDADLAVCEAVSNPGEYWSHRELASACAVSISTIQHHERTGLKAMRALLEASGITLDDARAYFRALDARRT